MDATHLPRVAMVITAFDLYSIRGAVAAVPDPEIPIITIEELGILRGVRCEGDEVIVTITPTYSGCPAMTQIAADIRKAAGDHARVRVETVYSPAWSTDWILPSGRRKLTAYGIAPPLHTTVAGWAPVLCPQCSSPATKTVSEFGSTACKALMVCEACREPFDRFKTL